MTTISTEIPEEELYCDAEDTSLYDNNKENLKNVPEVTEEVYEEEDYSGDDYNEELYDIDEDLNREDDNYKSNRYKSNNYRICVDKYEFNRHVTSALVEKDKRYDSEKIRMKDKSDRATVENVLDPHTLMLLSTLLDHDKISEVNGVISTGKEANVYHAPSKTGDIALKIFKTSILQFNNRDKYITGDQRFKRGYCKHNNRKKIRLWAEKEFRNLKRIESEGINVPKPIELKQHIILMEFIGDEFGAAPRLKDTALSDKKYRDLYRDVLIILWKLYHKTKLVHADFSEYNLLYWKGQLVVIDVSQAIEPSHPKAFEFLRRDCENISNYFKRKGVVVLTVKDLFTFLTDPHITEENLDKCLDALAEKAANYQEMTAEDEVDEAIFKNIHIPKRLNEIVHVERDITQSKSGVCNDPVFKNLVGLKPDLSGTVDKPAILREAGKNKKESEDEYSGSEISDSEEEEETGSKFKSCARPKHETPTEKKERKNAVKEEKREKRKTKVKKHIKKRMEKSGRK